MPRFCSRPLHALAGAGLSLGWSLLVGAAPDGAALDAAAGVPRAHDDALVVLDEVQRPATPSPAQPSVVAVASVLASQRDVELAIWDLGGSADPDHLSNKPGFHPAVRVVVNTRLLSGKRSSGALGPKALLAQTRNAGYWPFRLCFEQELRDRPNQQEGTALLRFSVGRAGTVTYVRGLRSDFSRAGTRCLRRAVYGLQFSAAPRSRVDADVSVQFSRGDVQVLARSASTCESLPAARAFAESAQPALRQCFFAARTHDEKLWGRLLFSLQLGAGGVVQTVAAEPAAWATPSLLRCAEEALKPTLFSGHAGVIRVSFRFGTPPAERTQ